MLGELGNLLLILALGFSAVQVMACLWGVFTENRRYLALGRVATYVQAVLMGSAFLTLMGAFLLCDFSLLTVVLHDHTQLPWYYRLAASWGNHEGSLLLFVLILSWTGGGLAFFSYHGRRPSLRGPGGAAAISGRLLRRAFSPPRNDEHYGRSTAGDTTRPLIFQGALVICFLSFLLLTSNPFTFLPFSLPEGQSLNPLLQDKSLLIHPPFLYLGYVGFSAPFSLSLTALWGRTDGEVWAAWVRPWALLAWSFLTLGITLGSWWAYYELGWGGWWFWDPVENASLMPWLAGTALLHVLRTQAFYRWGLLLSLLTFGFSLLGTFLVRSGLIASVHSFAQDPERSQFILALLGGIMGFALFFWVWRSPRFERTTLPLFSRRGLLFLNSLLLSVALAILCFGTLYPLWSEGMWHSPVAVGAPYFDRTLIPLVLPALLLIPVGSLLREGDVTLPHLLMIPLTASLGTCVLLLSISMPSSLWAFSGCVTALWILVGTGAAFFKTTLRAGPSLAHLGVAISLLGVSVGGGFRLDETRILKPTESLNIGPISLRFQNIKHGQEPTYHYERATLTFPGHSLLPEKRLYQPQNSLMSESAIFTNGIYDLYVILGPYQGDNQWLIRASLIPLAPWIWIGGFLMAVGALLSLVGRGGIPHLGKKILSPLRCAHGLRMTQLGSCKYSKHPTMCHPKEPRRGEAQDLAYKVSLIITLFLFLLPLPAFANTAAQDLYQEVRCPVCAGQSIADSERPEAQALKEFILQEFKDGKSADRIREELRRQFGQDILFRPPLESKTLFLWLFPFGLFFLVVCGFLWKGFRPFQKKY